MIYTLFLRHRVLVSLTASCALVLANSTLVRAEGHVDSEPPVQQNAAVTSQNTDFASTRVLFTRSAKAIGIALRNGDGVNEVVLDTAQASPRFTIAKHENPARLVLDIEGESVKSSLKKEIADLEFVSGLRIGSHPGKVRVVLDLAEGIDLAYNARPEKNSVVVTLKAATTPTSQEAAVHQAVAKPVESEGVSASPEPLLAVSNNDVEGSQPELQPASVVSQPVPAVSASASVRGVHIDRSGGIAVLKVEVSDSPEYSIARTAPSEYVLTLLNAAPHDESVTEPNFGEATDRIRSARATVEGQNTLVRIFCAPSAYLTARRVPQGVVVEETSNLTTATDDIRAQIKQEGEKKNSKADEVKTAADKVVATEPAASTTTATKSVDTKAKDNNSVDTQKASVSARKEKASKPATELEPVELNELQAASLLGNDSTYTGRLISLDLQETDIDNALRIIAEVSNLNIVASEEVTGKVTLRLLDVPWDQALDVILKSNGLDKVLEGNVMRIAPYDKLRQERDALKQARVAQEELAPVSVKYIRVSYAKASEIKSLVETVLSERGTVAHDERSNQLIIKDVQEGLKNVTELIKKVDLRTPQVLLETQIVEADRNLARELGSELGFQYIQSPSTGNGTGLNFPAAISIGGSAGPGIVGSAFPAAAGASAVSLLFDSADGTKTLETRLSQLEGEGRARVISRPAVATTNNKAAEIKSVQKIRIPLPNSGNTIGVGSGATASGAGGIATEAVEAGIILNVTPQASPDYYILLDIKAKSSSFQRDGLTTLPTEIERSASSTVLVSSGETFALGGIYKILESDGLNGVPFIKDIPFIGTFFRKTTTRNQDEELLFFITPRIVEGSFDDSAVKEKQ